MMIAVALVSAAAVNAQDRSATIIQMDYSCLLGRRTSPSYDVMVSYPERLVFTFENTKPINVRMAIYIPCCDYAQSVFPLTDEEIAQRTIASSTQLKATKTIGADFIRNGNHIIKRGEEGFVELKKQAGDKIQDFILEKYDTNSPSFIRASSSPYEWGMSNLMRIQDGTDEQLDDKIAQLKVTAFAVWRSDWQDDTDIRIATDIAPPTLSVQHFEPGTNTAFFQWYSYSNRNGANGKKVERIVYDDVYYVLENADTGEILAVLTAGRNASDDYRLLSRLINSDYITESGIDTQDMKMIYFIVTDGTCDYISVEAAKQLQTLFDFCDRECANGVVAYAVKDNVQGEKAFEPSDITWKLAANTGTRNPNLFRDSNGKYYLDGRYYLKSIFYKSFDNKGLAMGTGNPYFAGSFEPITFNHFPLLTPKADDFATGIENPTVEEVKVIWKGDVPYFAVNGQELKADIYDLTGKKVQFVERSKFYIVQAQTADGKKYAQKVIR